VGVVPACVEQAAEGVLRRAGLERARHARQIPEPGELASG